jgi:hypothetical protein
MKSKDLYDLLTCAQRFKTGDSVGPLGEVAKVFLALPSKSVADVVKRLDHLPPPTNVVDTELESVTGSIAILRELMAGRAKESLVKDLGLLEKLLRRFRGVDLDVFVLTAMKELVQAVPTRTRQSRGPLRSDLVDSYNRRLEEALGDDPGFRSVFGELSSDAAMGSSEAAALAKRFAHASARSRDAALKKILARHQALMTSRAKSLATAGRIAG